MPRRKRISSKGRAGSAKRRRLKPRASRGSSKGHAWKARQCWRLGQAYRSTAYRLHLGGVSLDIFPGCPSPRLAHWLCRQGARRFALITACNPSSCLLDVAENAARQARLAARLSALGLRFLPACNGPEAADWSPEPSFLVLDAPLALLLRLGRSFGQNALVAGRRGGRPRLVWLGRRSA